MTDDHLDAQRAGGESQAKDLTAHEETAKIFRETHHVVASMNFGEKRKTPRRKRFAQWLLPVILALVLVSAGSVGYVRWSVSRSSPAKKSGKAAASTAGGTPTPTPTFTPTPTPIPFPMPFPVSPSEAATLSPQTVSQLQLSWMATGIAGRAYGQRPVMVNGILYLLSAAADSFGGGNGGGEVLAFRTSGCGQGHCEPLWTTQSSDQITFFAATVSFLYALTPGTLEVFAAGGCGQSRCRPLWSASTAGGGSTPPIIHNGLVYVYSGTSDTTGLLSVFAASGCGQVHCQPLWRVQTEDRWQYNEEYRVLVVTDTTVYIATSPQTYSIRLDAFPAQGCGQTSCKPLWSTPVAQKILAASLLVANGMVYLLVASQDKQELEAFAANGCGRASCAPVWTTSGGALTGYDGQLVAASGMLYIIGGTVSVFLARGCGRTTCQPIWTSAPVTLPAGAVGMEGPAVVAGNRLYAAAAYVTGQPGTGNRRTYGLVLVFKAGGCGQTICQPVWRSVHTNSLIAALQVDNGVVYISTAFDNRTRGGGPDGMYAFAADGCAQEICQPLWQWTPPSTSTFPYSSIVRFFSLLIDRQGVYTLSENGILLAFAAPRRSNCSGNESCS